MPNNTIQVSYNEQGTKSVQHPNDSDGWNEVDACAEILKGGFPTTAVNVLMNEIRWFKKYSNQGLNVSDVYLGVSVSVDDYIVELESYL